MLISNLIEQLQQIKAETGDIEVTTLGTLNREDGEDVFESTVESMGVLKGEFGRSGQTTRLRLYWQMP